MTAASKRDMACKEIMDSACYNQKQAKVDCPIMIHPKCHPKSSFMVHVDGKKGLIYLSCGRCDRLVSVAKVKRSIGTKQ